MQKNTPGLGNFTITSAQPAIQVDLASFPSNVPTRSQKNFSHRLSFVFTHHTVTICLSVFGPKLYLKNCTKNCRISLDSIVSTIEISRMSNWLHTLQHFQTITDYVSVNKEVICETSGVLPVLNTNREHQKNRPKAKRGERQMQVGQLSSLHKVLPTRWPKLIAASYTRKKGHKAVLQRFASLDLNLESRGHWKIYRKGRYKLALESSCELEIMANPRVNGYKLQVSPNNTIPPVLTPLSIPAPQLP